MGERRHPLPEVPRDALGQLRGVHLHAARTAADALEAVGHALEPLQVGAHVARGELGDLVAGAVLEQGNPSAETRQGGAELVRGLTGHAGPDALALGAEVGQQGVAAGDQQQHEGEPLEKGDDTQPLYRGRIPVVDGRHPGRDDRLVLRVELANVGGETRVGLRRGDEGKVVPGRRPPAGVGHDDGDAELAQLAGEREQRRGAGVLAGVAQRAVDVRVHLAVAAGVAPQLADDPPGEDDVGHAEQQEPDRDENHRRHAAHPVSSQSSRSTPRYGRRASGTRTPPSGSWQCSRMAMMVRGKASPEPFSVCTNRGFSPGAGR
jgi:hypothetical protein